MTDNELIEYAKKAMSDSYSPYSGFTVGAALLSSDGTVFTGANIENGSFSATVCAERCAFFEAVKKGKRDFSAIAVCGARDGIVSDFCPPCGVCRQVMSEFCTADFRIIMTDGKNIRSYTLGELLPLSFSLGDEK